MGDSAANDTARDVWLAARRKGVGGSDVAAVLGLDPYRTALDVFLDKLGEHPTPIDDDDPPEPIRWGNLLEPVVAEEVARRTRLLVMHVPTQVHPEHEWMRVNIDRAMFRDGEYPIPYPVMSVNDIGVPQIREWKTDLSHASDPGVLECKTTSAWRAADWRGEDAPLPAVVQVCWAFAVTGWRWGSVAGLIGGQRLEIRDVDYDSDLVDDIVERVGSFWHDHVLPRKPPRAVGEDRGLLKRLYQGGLEAVSASPEILTAAQMYRQSATLEAYHRKQKRAAEAVLRQELGDHDAAIDPVTGDQVAWFTDIKPVEIKAHTRPASRRMYVRKDPQ